MPKHIPEVPLFDPAALTHHRRRNRLTQVELARRLAVHDNQIYRWEKGITPIRATELRRLAAQLRLHPAQLQRRLDAPPTLTDLRSLRALTRQELAHRLHIRLHRLTAWENGRLGPEQGPILAAHLDIGDQAVDVYERTGRLPAAITHRLARALRVTTALAEAAFHNSRTTGTHRGSPTTAIRTPIE
ncbi:hypothetical protein GCM10022243_13690 [Saccharothrix violaceirubra]|uniref:DNA-binding transcriptional regulator YiaG n=1 Tax=Saccharothrix violaceirubra TaxID=413306 RepID=A0A7W7WTU4_9PSEU|nr:helix-turn-helix transcriptional regulator [Saccharothrix violaceirubra]MBB4963511.1 DNA-binding transcriptional regulator YiaG [Saccharothrix violaceirubra]